MSAVLLLTAIAALLLGYIFYGRYVGKSLGVDPARPTPAHTMHDGVDYHPTKPALLFGHHFAGIAGTAAIVGPVVAVGYGWLPVLLWIILGAIFIGAVHDLGSIVTSLRHQGRSMGEAIGRSVGYPGRQLFLLFVWIFLVFLSSILLGMVADLFKAVPSSGTSSLILIGLAPLFGLTVSKGRSPLWLASIIGVVLVGVAVVLGWYYPLTLSKFVWQILLVAYIFIVSVTPVWIFIQPRGYLNSFLIFFMMGVMIVGLFVVHPPLQLPAWTSWNVKELGPLFPTLFVVVAGGAISGLHSVIASAMTAKQIDSEKDIVRIGYGAMLTESLLAVLVLLTVASLTPNEYWSGMEKVGPVEVFTRGGSAILARLGVNQVHGAFFLLFVVSAFVMSSLDAVARVGRIVFQEFFAPRSGVSPSLWRRHRFVGATVTVLTTAVLCLASSFISESEWSFLWRVFGTANQLLAALALLAVTLGLAKSKGKVWLALIPMAFMFAVAITALVRMFLDF